MTDDQQRDAQRDRWADTVLGTIEDVIYWGIAVVLVVGAVVLLGVQAWSFTRLVGESASILLLDILDGLLLVFIFVELLFAVRATLRSHEIVAEPFLVIGIIACIKEVVVLSVEAADLLSEGPEFSRAMTQVGVLGGLVLLLSVAMYVLRLRRQEAAGDVGEEAVDAGEDAQRDQRDQAQARLQREGQAKDI